MKFQTNVVIRGFVLVAKADVKVSYETLDYGTKEWYEVEVYDVEVYSDRRKCFVTPSKNLLYEIEEALYDEEQSIIKEWKSLNEEF